ncbi:MAG: adenylosuccinate synthase [Chitinophagales bacterium]|nr:adenylosuccinate synthase [Bacteroidota bacterium]MCB9042675.1 adenylosuccinate synthase [Chitinophagales bacterium]
MKVDVLLGLQWGDEGKGKIVDYLAENYQIVARFQGGPNAGHTLYYQGKKIVLHTIPSGVFQPHLDNVIGNGVVIDPVVLKKEIETLNAMDVDICPRLYISRKAHLILPTHKILDQASEQAKGNEKIGSTLRGIGPAYMDKTGRNGLRIGDIETADFSEKYEKLRQKHLHLLKLYDFSFSLEELETTWFEAIVFLKKFQLIDAEYFIQERLQKGERVLAEGAQGSMLDIEFGTYPYVTSSNTLTSGVCQGLGIAPTQIERVWGVSKAYCTRVGGGPFPTELFGEEGEALRAAGNEFGATTGRPRRCGWIDLPALKYAIMLNGATDLVITKADVLNHLQEIKVGTHYKIGGKATQKLPYDINTTPIEVEYTNFKAWGDIKTPIESIGDLPEALQGYVAFLEKELDIPVSIISVGPERNQLVVK